MWPQNTTIHLQFSEGHGCVIPLNEQYIHFCRTIQ